MSRQAKENSLKLTDLPIELLDYSCGNFLLPHGDTQFAFVSRQFYAIYRAQLNIILGASRLTAEFIVSLKQSQAEQFVVTYYSFGSPLYKRLQADLRSKSPNHWDYILHILTTFNANTLDGYTQRYKLGNMIQRLRCNPQLNVNPRLISSLQGTLTLLHGNRGEILTQLDEGTDYYINKRCFTTLKLFQNAFLARAILPEAPLNGADLERATMSDAIMPGSFLFWANMSHVNAWGANFQDAYLGDAIMHAINLREAKLQRATLDHAILTHALLWEANLEWASLQFADLSFARLWDANLTSASFRGANLENADLTGAIVKNTDFSDIKINENTVFPKDLTGAKFLADEVFKDIHAFQQALAKAMKTFENHIEFNAIKKVIAAQIISHLSDHVQNEKLLTMLKLTYYHFVKDEYADSEKEKTAELMSNRGFFASPEMSRPSELKRFIFEDRAQKILAEAHLNHLAALQENAEALQAYEQAALCAA